MANWITSEYVPNKAIHVGYDDDNNDIFVGRAYHESSEIPGKVIPARNVCYVPYAGVEHEKNLYEYLCASNHKWIMFNEDINIANDGVEGGADGYDGEPYYVGRVLHRGTYVCGAIKLSHNCCYIPYEGMEIPFSEFEVLVIES